MAATSSTTLIRAEALVATPWKNGGGVTREIAAAASAAATTFDAFSWRVSVADVAQPGPFSRFDGVDRTLVLLSGAGMTLVEEGGARHVLARPLDRLAFAGEMALRAELHDGPTRDFNLMVRRELARGDVAIWCGGARERLDADTVLLFCVAGELAVALDGGAESYTLYPFDTLRIDAPAADASCAVRGEGTLLAVRVTRVNPTATARPHETDSLA
jgi:environmental stress-induced protein Ves